MEQETLEPLFKIGDVVTLKSGGENMTISGLRKEVNTKTLSIDLYYGYVFCDWFEGKMMKRDKFHQDMLKLVV